MAARNKPVIIPRVERDQIISLFLGMEENSYDNIAKITGHTKYRVMKTIDEYYEKKRINNLVVKDFIVI